MDRLWKRVLNTLISLLIPPLSEKEITVEPLTSPQLAVVFKWLKMLKAFFNASEGGVEYGLPLATLQSGAYRDLLLIGQYLDLSVLVLKEKCSAAVKGIGRTSSKVIQGQEIDAGSGSHPGSLEDQQRTAEILMRILRTR